MSPSKPFLAVLELVSRGSTILVIHEVFRVVEDFRVLLDLQNLNLRTIYNIFLKDNFYSTMISGDNSWLVVATSSI